MNARFEILAHGEQVTLTLRPGQSLSWGTWARTDEGWSSEFATWEFDGEYVTRDCGTDGRDCDGRLSSAHVARCHVSRLRAHSYDIDGVIYHAPDWDTVEHSQRDYAAEAAGY